MTREERLAILGPDTVAKIRARVKEAPEPSDELVEKLRRIMTNPGATDLDYRIAEAEFDCEQSARTDAA